MHRPRVLIITANPVIALAYAERLEKAFSVEVVGSEGAALSAISREQPAAIVLDLVLPEVSAPELLETIRASLRVKAVPVFTLPCIHGALEQAVQQSGGVTVMERGTDPILRVEQALRGALDLAPLAGSTLSFREPPAETAALLNSLRAGLHTVSHDAGNEHAWRALAVQAHHVTDAIALGGPSAASQVAAAFEALAADLAAMPDQANPSVLCTMSQAADFLGVLLEPTRLLREAEAGRVLIVDDEPSALQLVSAAVQFVGLVPVQAATPSAALAAASGSHFDVIFLDVGLPEMSGFELCSQLRATSAHDRTPIVFLTGMVTFNNRARSSLSGGNDFVGKPFHLLELGLKALIWAHKGKLQSA